MSTGWLILIFFAGLLLFFFALGMLTRGTGADLVDWDPAAKAATDRLRDSEDLRQLLQLENEARRRRGLPPLTEEDVRRGALTGD